MKFKITLIAILCLGWLMSDDLTSAAAPPPKAEQVYEKREYQSTHGTLRYRLLEPESINPGEKYPLVLFLHGAGERGDDNTKQLIHGLPEFVTPDNRGNFPCFVVAPQCPSEKKWVEVDWTLTEHEMPEEKSESMQLTWELLHKMLKEDPVDPQRIYITGLSMGGYGTWDLIQRHPDFFAAAIPVCGGADEKYADRLTKLPIWAFHGDRDTAVPLIRTTRMISAIEDAGGAPKMTVYPGVGHNSWTATYANRKVLEWMFSQKKPSAANSKCE